MSRCPEPQELDGYAFEELGPVRAAQLALHASDCERCARELAWLRAEREALELRAQQRRVPTQALFRQLERRLPPAPPSRLASPRLAPLLLAGAYLAVLLLTLPLRAGSRAASAPGSAARPAGALSSLDQAMCAPPAQDGIEQLDSEFAACLIATPVPGTCVDDCR